MCCVQIFFFSPFKVFTSLPVGLCCRGRPTRPPPSPPPSVPAVLVALILCSTGFMSAVCVTHTHHICVDIVRSFHRESLGSKLWKKEGWPIIHVTMETEPRSLSVTRRQNLTYMYSTAHKILFKLVPVFLCSSEK